MSEDSERGKAAEGAAGEAPSPKPANIAPDAVKDPNEKTEGKPGAGPGGAAQNDEADTGGG